MEFTLSQVDNVIYDELNHALAEGILKKNPN